MPRCIPIDAPRFGTSGGDVFLEQDESDATVRTPGAIIRCFGVLASRFGYPNDEALRGDPLFACGLRYYGVVEVLDSQWLADVNRRNRVAFPNFRGYQRRHYFFAFHDSSFEVLCHRLECQPLDSDASDGSTAAP